MAGGEIYICKMHVFVISYKSTVKSEKQSSRKKCIKFKMKDMRRKWHRWHEMMLMLECFVKNLEISNVLWSLKTMFVDCLKWKKKKISTENGNISWHSNTIDFDFCLNSIGNRKTSILSQSWLFCLHFETPKWHIILRLYSFLSSNKSYTHAHFYSVWAHSFSELKCQTIKMMTRTILTGLSCVYGFCNFHDNK